MGLNKNTERTTFLSIMDGKLVLAHKQPTADTVERVNKLGKVVYEEHFTDVEGKLVDIATREHQEYGKQWNVKFESGGETFVIQMSYSGRDSSSFLKALPNVDLTKSFKFKPWSMIDKNNTSRKVSGVTLYQGGKIEPAYTKNNPNGLPEMVQVKRKGKMEWDDSEMMEFLENMVKNEIVPKLKAKSQAVAAGDAEPEEAEDLPF